MKTMTMTKPTRQRACGLWLLCAVGMANAAGPTPGEMVTSDKADVAYRVPGGLAEMDRSPNERRDWLDDLSHYVAKRASRTLPDGERLLVTITDVQRDGMLEPWRRGGASDVRVVRDATPPRIDLEFRLVGANGAVLKEGSRQLRDIAFLTHGGFFRSESLAYEKNLIDDWMRRDFGPTQR